MVINRNKLLNLAPIKNMETTKLSYFGTSYGLSEAGYDIRIAQDIKFYRRTNEYEIRGPLVQNNWGSGNFVLASAIEEFQMPKKLMAIVHDKSTWARKGLSVFNTVIEPGWNGFLTLELVYNGSEDLYIRRGQGIAQVIFHKLAKEADYGNGKYQNQPNHPVSSKE